MDSERLGAPGVTEHNSSGPAGTGTSAGPCSPSLVRACSCRSRKPWEAIPQSRGPWSHRTECEWRRGQAPSRSSTHEQTVKWSSPRFMARGEGRSLFRSLPGLLQPLHLSPGPRTHFKTPRACCSCSASLLPFPLPECQRLNSPTYLAGNCTHYQD